MEGPGGETPLVIQWMQTRGGGGETSLVVQWLTVNADDTGSVPGPGKSHIPLSN